jgi:hypothetical protein
MVEYKETVQTELTPVKLPLTVRKELRDYDSKRVDALNKIRDVSGIDFKFDVDIGQLYNNPDIPSDKKTRLGLLVYDSQLSNLATLFEQFLKEDEMSKEAFTTTLGDKKIIRYIVDKNIEDMCPKYLMGSYTGLTIKDGELWMVTHPDYVGFGNSYDIEPFGELFESDQFPLIVRRNIRDAEPVRDKNLERIKKATGIDFVFICDFLSIYNQVKDSMKAYEIQTLGDRIYGSQLGNLAYTLEEFSKDEMCKESLEDVCGDKKTIRYLIGNVVESCPNCRYSDMAGIGFKDGELVLVTSKDRVGFGNVLFAADLEKDL